jgi:hypothetical protein
VTIGALLPAYRELLALHVISVIVWMEGMIMLPAIYARHMTTTPEVARDAGFVELERGIIKRFVNPAMYAAWGFGILQSPLPARFRGRPAGGGRSSSPCSCCRAITARYPHGVVACGTAPIATACPATISVSGARQLP